MSKFGLAQIELQKICSAEDIICLGDVRQWAVDHQLIWDAEA